jgi:pterin-4a-carbinolamine dehydratase
MTSEHVYNPDEIVKKLDRELPTWEYRDGVIRRKFVTPGWPYTLMAVNAVGFLAEAAFHHPDMTVSWGFVTVKLSTHSAGGITDKDFELAGQIEARLTWKPAEADALDGFEKGFKKKWVR